MLKLVSALFALFRFFLLGTTLVRSLLFVSRLFLRHHNNNFVSVYKVLYSILLPILSFIFSLRFAYFGSDIRYVYRFAHLAVLMANAFTRHFAINKKTLLVIRL